MRAFPVAPPTDFSAARLPASTHRNGVSSATPAGSKAKKYSGKIVVYVEGGQVTEFVTKEEVVASVPV